MRARLEVVGWDADLRIDPDPTLASPGPGQVAVRVEACGVCHRDCIDRDGRWPFLRLPVTPGHEAVGRVIAVGVGVRDWKVGDRVATLHRDACGTCARCAEGDPATCGAAFHVFGILADGGYSRWLAAPERALYAAPPDASAAEAAVLHCTFGTAYQALRRAEVRAGDRVLVTGANGGVGMAAIQVARRLGAEPIAVVRDGRHRDALLAVGAAAVVADAGDTFHKRLPGGPVDIALECVGQPTFNASLRGLRQGGALVVIGNVVAERASVNLGLVIMNALRIFGSRSASSAEMAELVALRGGEPFALPLEELPLAAADAAQRRVRAGGLEGRLVLIP